MARCTTARCSAPPRRWSAQTKIPSSPRAGRDLGTGALDNLSRSNRSFVTTLVSTPLLLLKFESPPRRRRRPIVSQRAKFDLAFDDPEIEIMHETAIAAHLAELALLRPNPLTVDDLVIAPSHRLASP